MIYYLIAALSPLVGWLVHGFVSERNRPDRKTEYKQRAWILLFSILPMVLLFVLRYKYVGSDTIGYVSFFQYEIREESFGDIFAEFFVNAESGFRLYCKLISLITDSYTVFFLFNALIIFGSLYRFALKYTTNPFVLFYVLITLGTYQFFESGLRQALAMAICLFAVDFIKDRKIIRFAVLIFLAYLFHKSAVIFALLYPLCLVKRYRWMLPLYAVLATVFGVGFGFFQDLFNELLGYTYTIEETGNGGIFMLLVLAICAYSLVTMSDKRGDRVNQTVIVQMALMTVVFWVLRLISRTAERVSYYFIFGLYAFFSQTTRFYDSKASLAIKMGIIVACLALFVYRNFGIGYTFFWQGV